MTARFPSLQPPEPLPVKATRTRILSRPDFSRPTLEVARTLLGKYLVRRNKSGVRSARIIEVEAYVGPDDRASHALASAKPARALEAGKKWGERVNVEYTPTILLDGNIKAESINRENLGTIIRSILDSDSK